MGRGKRLVDIVEIPLPNGKKVYGRVYKEYVVAIYEGQYDSYNEKVETDKYFRFIGLYRLDLNKLRTVAKCPFENEEDAWRPDGARVDEITIKESIYSQGQIIPCSYQECNDLEVIAVWHICHLVDMLMGDDK